MEKTTLVILAGGKSSRFGRDKSLVEINGRRLVETTVMKCLPVFDEVMISSNKDSKFGIPGVPELKDVYLDMGPLGGVHSAFLAARNDAVFFAACDMPFFNTDLAQLIIENSAGREACVPKVGEKIEPLFAVYRKSLLPKTMELLKAGRKSLRDLMEVGDTNILDCTVWVEEHGAQDAFFNMNYEADFQRLQKKH
ncbi:MAG: molybdenum cofactor guanylyltransferase [Oscillospiraceae bacterium]|nr:molybdenum cofactor guanylyltransferase [Oscillospiraceae bacterium]